MCKMVSNGWAAATSKIWPDRAISSHDVELVSSRCRAPVTVTSPSSPSAPCAMLLTTADDHTVRRGSKPVASSDCANTWQVCTIMMSANHMPGLQEERAVSWYGRIDQWVGSVFRVSRSRKAKHVSTDRAASRRLVRGPAFRGRGNIFSTFPKTHRSPRAYH